MIRPRHSLYHSLCASALLVLWIGAPLLGAVHLQMGDHSFCVEHQALEHRTFHSVHAVKRVYQAQSAPEKQSHIEKVSSEPDHQRCFVAESRSIERYTFTEDPGTDSLVDTFIGIEIFSQTLNPVIDILIGAPKNSPPLLLS